MAHHRMLHLIFPTLTDRWFNTIPLQEEKHTSTTYNIRIALRNIIQQTQAVAAPTTHLASGNSQRQCEPCYWFQHAEAEIRIAQARR